MSNKVEISPGSGIWSTTSQYVSGPARLFELSVSNFNGNVVLVRSNNFETPILRFSLYHYGPFRWVGYEEIVIPENESLILNFFPSPGNEFYVPNVYMMYYEGTKPRIPNDTPFDETEPNYDECSDCDCRCHTDI